MKLSASAYERNFSFRDRLYDEYDCSFRHTCSHNFITNWYVNTSPYTTHVKKTAVHIKQQLRGKQRGSGHFTALLLFRELAQVMASCGSTL